MRKMLTSAIIAAATAAVAGGAGLAAASTHSGASGTEHFQLMTTSATSSNLSLIASGVFTAPAVDHEHRATNTATFVFSNGTINLKHSKGTGTQNFNPKTCLLTVNEHGTYNLTSGTGAYTGITGSGKYQLSILAIGAKSGGKCVQNKPPVAFHQVINASGPVSLP
jgi:hypothetical protein